MWRNLFSERMALKAHLEQREKGVFALVLAHEGRISANLKRTDVDCSVADAAPTCTRLGAGVLTTNGMSMGGLARTIQPMTGRTVVDRTGLGGLYAFGLTASMTRPNPGINPDNGSARPSIFAALEEQLGLKLVTARAPVDVLVIEHIERPTEN
jgi:uncharacterized protein (TIGR03435 family)